MATDLAMVVLLSHSTAHDFRLLDLPVLSARYVDIYKAADRNVLNDSVALVSGVDSKAMVSTRLAAASPISTE